MAICCLVELATAYPARGQQPVDSKPAQPAPSSAPVVIPDDAKMTLLIQLSMAALALGNLTGEYGPLYAMTSTEFRKSHPVSDLVNAFQSYRMAGMDISPLLLFPPVLFGRPAITAAGEISVAGRYETLPQHVHFNLKLQAENGSWRVAHIATQLVTPPVPVATGNALQQPRAAPPNPKKR